MIVMFEIIGLRPDFQGSYLYKKVEMKHPPHKGEKIEYFNDQVNRLFTGTVVECIHIINALPPLVVRVELPDLSDDLMDSLNKDGWSLSSKNLG